jgi:hypothetical protein
MGPMGEAARKPMTELRNNFTLISYPFLIMDIFLFLRVSWR